MSLVTLRSMGFAAMANEVVDRLARLEEQVHQLAVSVDKLASRDAELDASFRGVSERFTAALNGQSEMFHHSLEETTKRFVTREDWTFWKNLLTAALFAMMAYGWSNLTGTMHR